MKSIIRSAARILSQTLSGHLPSLHASMKDIFLALPAAVRGRQFVHDHLASLPGAQTFALIGANDGQTNDHASFFVRKRGWTGVAVEPVPQYFRQLQAHYAGYPVKCLNVAVHDTETTMPFYWLEDSGSNALPGFAKGVGSFNRANVEMVIREHPEFASYLCEKQVTCVPFDTAVKMAELPKIDVVIVDTEGYDAQIIAQIDFDRWQTRTVVFEHKLLSEAELEHTTKLLERYGFRWESDSFDILAWRDK